MEIFQEHFLGESEAQCVFSDRGRGIFHPVLFCSGSVVLCASEK